MSFPLAFKKAFTKKLKRFQQELSEKLWKLLKDRHRQRGLKSSLAMRQKEEKSR